MILNFLVVLFTINQDLHVFVHASNRAYGTVVYTVCHENSNLVLSKAHVTPCRENRVTIPKLELTLYR